jgi:spermidine synthase
LVDLDPEMTSLPERFAPLGQLNAHSLADPRVHVLNQDAFLWLQNQESGTTFDAAIVDFPDPGTFSIGKLYTTRFFRHLRSRIAPEGAVAVQCTSPLVAPQAYWCIIRTLEAAGFRVHPYHVTVPAFGIWGFALATPQPSSVPSDIPAEVAPHLRFLDRATLATLFQFPTDLRRVETEINRLDNQVLVRYYDAEWRKWD